MSQIEANKALARRFFNDLFNAGNPDVVDEIMVPDLINYGTPADPHGAQTFKRVAAAIIKTWPERHYTINDLIAEDDRVMALVTLEATHGGTPDMPVYQGSLAGQPPTGKRIQVQHVHIFRMRDGKITEHWGIRDDLGMLRQLGIRQLPAS